MRRLSWMISVAATLVFSGCESPQPAGSMSLPEPDLQTRRPRPPVRQAQPPPVAQTPPTYGPTINAVVKPPPSNDANLDTSTLMPPGGIEKKWSVIVVHHSANPN